MQATSSTTTNLSNLPHATLGPRTHSPVGEVARVDAAGWTYEGWVERVHYSGSEPKAHPFTAVSYP